MTCCRPKLPCPSVFSYHAILSSDDDAETTSVSPSPSRSAAKTDRGAFAEAVMTCCGPKLPIPSVFSYHANAV